MATRRNAHAHFFQNRAGKRLTMSMSGTPIIANVAWRQNSPKYPSPAS